MSIRYRYLIAGAVSLASVAAVTACKSDDNSGGGDNGPPPAKSGSVELTNSKLSIGDVEHDGYSAKATFTDTTGLHVADQYANCTLTQDGNCKVYSCNLTSGDSGTPPVGDAGTVKVVGAGKISITGGKDQVDLAANSDGTYPEVASETSLLWSGAESISISAAGDANGVGAFNASLPAPSFVTVSAPTFDQGHASIDRSKDLQLAWSAEGAATGDVEVTLADPLGRAAAICTYPVSAGQGTIAGSTLGKFSAGTGEFALLTKSTQVQQVGDWQVTLSLTSVFNSSGGAVTFQ